MAPMHDTDRLIVEALARRWPDVHPCAGRRGSHITIRDADTILVLDQGTSWSEGTITNCPGVPVPTRDSCGSNSNAARRPWRDNVKLIHP
jgi:hypothetical protein